MRICGTRGFSLLEVLVGVGLSGSIFFGSFMLLMHSMRVCLDNYGVEHCHEVSREYLYLVLKKDFQDSLEACCVEGLIEKNKKPFRELNGNDLKNFFENLKNTEFSINKGGSNNIHHSLLLLGSSGEVKSLYEMTSEEISGGLQHAVNRFENTGNGILTRTHNIQIHAREYTLKAPDQLLPRIEAIRDYIRVLFPTGYGASRLSSVNGQTSSRLKYYFPGSAIFKTPFFNYKNESKTNSVE